MRTTCDLSRTGGGGPHGQANSHPASEAREEALGEQRGCRGQRNRRLSRHPTTAPPFPERPCQRTLLKVGGLLRCRPAHPDRWPQLPVRASPWLPAGVDRAGEQGFQGAVRTARRRDSQWPQRLASAPSPDQSYGCRMGTRRCPVPKTLVFQWGRWDSNPGPTD